MFFFSGTTGQCKPGSHSLNGLEICESCPLGHFQPAFGARECLVCPDETSTVTRGAVGEAECGGKCSGLHLQCYFNSATL